MVNGRELHSGAMPAQEALDKAAAFLEGQGYSSMEPVSYDVSDTLVTATFAYVGEEVLFYPDSVTVSIAREGGDVVGFSAREYLMNHSSTRTAGTARVKAEDAGSLAPEGHTMESARYAVILSPGGLENHALELTTSMGDRRYLYYLDALSGDELSLSSLHEDEQDAAWINSALQLQKSGEAFCAGRPFAHCAKGRPLLASGSKRSLPAVGGCFGKRDCSRVAKGLSRGESCRIAGADGLCYNGWSITDERRLLHWERETIWEVLCAAPPLRQFTPR